MTWWTAAVEKSKQVGTRIVTDSKWYWDNSRGIKAASAVLKFSANTLFHFVEQALALRQAAPSLITNPRIRQYVYGVNNLLIYDVAPALALNYANNWVQSNYGNDSDNTNILSLNFIKLGNYVVTAYLWRQGVATCARVFVLDSVGPPAFNSDKESLPPSLCVEKQCNGKRKLKGLGREPLILLANDGLIYGISYIPLVGNKLSFLLSILNTGRYITRLATPERCERHKEMEQEFVLALGLTYWYLSSYIEQGLDSTMGPQPVLYTRAINHILINLMVNVATHMKVPLTKSNEATLPFDIFNMYEAIWRAIIDVNLKLMVQFFNPEPGSRPVIALSTVLQTVAKAFNSDKEIEGRVVDKKVYPLRAFFLPKMLHGSHYFINDSVVKPNWQSLQQGALYTLNLIYAIGRDKRTNIAENYVPKMDTLINLKFGIPKKVTRILMMLRNERDFWDLTMAIKLWLERHGEKNDLKFEEPQGSFIPLHGEKELLPLPENLVTPVIPFAQLDRTPTQSHGDNTWDRFYQPPSRKQSLERLVFTTPQGDEVLLAQPSPHLNDEQKQVAATTPSPKAKEQLLTIAASADLLAFSDQPRNRKPQNVKLSELSSFELYSGKPRNIFKNGAQVSELQTGLSSFD